MQDVTSAYNFTIVDQHCEKIQRILVIEDLHSLADHLQNNIKKKNHVECDVAYGETAAKALLQEYKYQLIIVDLYLQDSSGSFIGWLLRHKYKIFVMTARPNLEERARLIKLPIVDYLHKSDEKSLSRYICDSITRLVENRNSLVVICDDSKMSRRHVVSTLVNQNIPYLEVVDGKEAIECIIKQKIKTTLLISDFEMPNMDGLELTRHIRLEFDPLDLPILIQSGRSEDYNVANILKAGANEYVQKPLAHEEFLARINSLLDHSRMHTENQELTKKLNIAAMRDSLTGLYNRNYFYEHIAKIISQSLREECKYGIIMLDIDHFKSFNDSYGHDVGDEVLVEVSKSISECLRISDIACRWGGEEFLVVLQKCDFKVADMLAQRIRENVAKLKIQVKDLDEILSVTISGGVAISKDNSINVDDVIKLADSRLYVAKKTGRNKIVTGDNNANS